VVPVVVVVAVPTTLFSVAVIELNSLVNNVSGLAAMVS
jgi:hypothetical protein